MKRFWMIALVLGLVAGFGLAMAFSSAYAQSGTPANPQGPWGQGMMNGRGGMMGGGHGGMMGGFARQGGTPGAMHEYMQTALAAELGMELEDFQALWNEGQTFWEIAAAVGVSTEDAQQMMTDAHAAALDTMVAEGVITSEQADFMKTRMSGGFGAGGCQGGGRGGMMRGNWLQGEDS
jgi:hypothetical protein